jgi:hypothetical protein
VKQHTKIEDLFVYPIKREITTVITMDDLRLPEIEQELSEYVVTDAIEDMLIDFLEQYVETRTAQTNRIGVWISGFFGSGKSHFSKILSYLLENRVVGNQHAVDLFKMRIVGSPRQAEIERLLHQALHFIDTETIAFQIKTEEDLLADVPISAVDREAGNHISTIMYRQWLAKRGLSTTLWVGRLELELESLGQYQAFRERVQALEGKRWEAVRQHDMLVRDAAVKALCDLLPERYASEERASKAIDDIQAGLEMGPSILANELSAWVDRQRRAGSEKTPHLAFIIDEMGQFIGDSNQRLLELQSIAEAFGTHGLGKLWLVVTAQEALEEVVREAIRRENEFDKIRDRFSLRLSLTSENIEKVLEERILKKKESKRSDLDAMYHQASGNIATVCTLKGANRPLPQPDLDRFIADYPFPPYQLSILQQIFAAVRTPGGEQEKIEGTERSLIGVTQAILKSPETGFASSPVGRLISFDEVYDQIENELPSVDRRTIDEVDIPPNPSFLKCILKALYLIQRLEWVPRTADNLARLLVGHVSDPETPFVALRDQVAEGLESLEKGHYVVGEGGQYEFLSGVKKDIELDIARVNVTVNDRRREIKKYLRAVLDIGRVNYRRVKRFDVQVRGDDDVIHDKGAITLQVYSPIYVRAIELSQDEVLQRSYGDERTLYWRPAPAEDLYRQLGRLIRAETVVQRRMSRQDKSPEEESILFQKQREVDTMRSRIQSLLRQSLLDGAIIYNGEVRNLEGRTGQVSTIFGREVSQVIPHVYTRFEPAAVRVDERSIEQILTAPDVQLMDIEPALHLFDDAQRLNRHSPVVSEVLEDLRLRARAGDPRDGKALTDFFGDAPYGWDPILVRIVLAALFRVGVVSLRYEGRAFPDYKVSSAQELLTKALPFRKTAFLYDPQEGLTSQERKQIQKAIDRIFHRVEPDTVNIMAAALEEELDELQAQNREQRILAQERELPVQSILQTGEEAIQEIAGHAHSDRRLKAFLGHTDLLRELKAYQDRLQGFIDAGYPTQFRQARRLQRAVERGQAVAPSLRSNRVQGWLDEMRAIETHHEIVEKWAAYYQNMQPLLQNYQAAYEALHQARHEAYAEVKAELEELGIPADSLNDRLCEGSVGWALDGLTCTTCGTGLETLYYQTQSASEEKARLIRQHTPPPDDEGEEFEFEILRLYDVIQTRDISSIEELDAAIDELRQAVQEALEAGKHVVLG